MTQNPALDAAVRLVQHLLFAFNGPIRSKETDGGPGTNTPTALHIYEALAACYESGRSAVVIDAKEQTVDVPAYLDRRDLFTLITLIATSVADAISFLKIAPADCLLISSSPADIESAQAAGVPAIDYVRAPGDADRLDDSRATILIYSMTDLAFSLRSLRPSS